MKSKYFKFFSIVSSFILAAGVYIGIKPTCAGALYQPKAPKHLA